MMGGGDSFYHNIMRRLTVTVLFWVFLAALACSRWYLFDATFNDAAKRAPLLWRGSSEQVVFVEEISNSSPAGTRFFARTYYGGRVLVRSRYLKDLSRGEKLVVRGKLESISSADDEGFLHYLKLKNIIGIVEQPLISRCLESDFSIIHYFLSVRAVLTTQINKLFSQDVAGLLSGILLGDDDFLSKQTKEQFRIAGLSHVMAISGSNMTMVAEVVFLLLGFLPLRKKVVVTVIILSIFTLLVGASAAVLRAYFMAIIALFALHLGLPYLAWRGLFFVIVAMFFVNPYVPIYDIGFQLSVMATLGLLVLNPILTRVLKFMRYSWLKDIVAITLSASVFTLPISLHYFGIWFPLSLLINVFLVPVISGLSILGYVGVTLTVIPLLGEIVRLFLELVFRALLVCVDFSSSLSGKVALLVPFPWVFVGIYYLVLLLVIRFFVWKGPGKTSRVNILP